MCGIAGVMPGISEHLFTKSLDSIAHRGPDGFGIWKDEDDRIMLGHRRLAIIDLSAGGKQPMSVAEKYMITYNGEIYNFIELRNELKSKGYIFHTDSDTEVIPAAFDAWGVDCLHRFNGMWAFAIWNRIDQTLFLSRDRFGKKPLFYSFANKRFAFASEMKALANLSGEISVSADFNWCKENIFLYEATDKTLLKDISRFPAGSYAFIKATDTGLVPVQFYSTINYVKPVPKKYDDQVQQFRELFTDACMIRMRSDVPVGTALSGGLDSSAVISTMAHIDRQSHTERVTRDWQHAFVACFKGSFLDERNYAKQVVDHLGIPATYLEIDPVRGIGELMDDIYFFEELYITSPIPMMRTYAAIKEAGVTVSIDGHGADEMMSGYGPDLLESLLDAGIQKNKINSILHSYRDYLNIPVSDWPKAKSRKIYIDTIKSRLPGTASKMMFYLRAAINKHQPGYREHPQIGYLNNLLYDLFHKSVLPTLLRNYDRYSMASGVEIRMPFMDHRLVEFGFSLPWSSKIKNGFTKAIIRDAVRPYMPAAITDRKSKIGFNTPITEWLQGPWKEYFLDHIASQDFLQCDLIHPVDVRKNINNAIFNKNASFRDGEAAWTGIQPYFWKKGFLDKIQSAL